MNKRLITALIIAAAASLAISADAVSAGLLSPGLRHYSEDMCMIRSSLTSRPVTFSKKDFELALGCPQETITITALPPVSEGTLYYGDMPAAVNQVFNMSGIGDLRFIPASGCTQSSFRFKADGDYSIPCIMKYTDHVNSPPEINSAKDIEVWTQKDIAVWGTLSASDPDSDTLTYEIAEYPRYGLIEITDPSSGDYRYTPCAGMRGSDSFTYIVRDEWGAYSDTAEVYIDIDEAAADLVFADMDGHWAHNAALVMAADGAMEVRTSGSDVYFDPEEEVTREDFLVTVMKALGAGDIEPCSTVFADDGKISKEASGYIARAYNLGIIKGSEENGLLCFNPSASVTRAEAAVILNSIIGADTPDVIPVFADDGTVPAWAKASIYALSDAGVFKGTGSGKISPNDVLNRAQTAQILLTVKKIYG